MTINLLKENNNNSLENFMSESRLNYLDIECDKGLISIENRPYYCDRGQYIVKVFSNCPKTFYIDEEDMFPRYYFIFDNLLSELDCWLRARSVKVISINKKGEETWQPKAVTNALAV